MMTCELSFNKKTRLQFCFIYDKFESSVKQKDFDRFLAICLNQKNKTLF